MLTQYIERAMGHAHYEIMENKRFWGEIPGLQGVWAEGETLEESGRPFVKSWKTGCSSACEKGIQSRSLMALI